MKGIWRVLLALIAFTFVTACASTGKIQLPEKYVLGNKFQQVDEIYRTRIMSWYDIDKQSLFIQTAPSEYYLIVLMVPSYDLPFRNRIRITHSGSEIKAHLDSVIVYSGAHTKQSYPIDRMYKIKGQEQMNEVLQLLTGSKSNESRRTEKRYIDNIDSEAI
jgi:hypothetical protein